MKPFDIVLTPKGGVAIITEINKGSPQEASINYIKGMNPGHEHNAWWREGDGGLKVVDSVLSILANAMAHPFGQNDNQGDRYFLPATVTDAQQASEGKA